MFGLRASSPRRARHDAPAEVVDLLMTLAESADLALVLDVDALEPTFSSAIDHSMMVTLDALTHAGVHIVLVSGAGRDALTRVLVGASRIDRSVGWSGIAAQIHELHPRAQLFVVTDDEDAIAALRDRDRALLLTRDPRMAVGGNVVAAAETSVRAALWWFIDERSAVTMRRRAAARRTTAALEILLVDDNVDAVETLAELLRLHGHRVITAYDGAIGLRRCQELVPDLAVLDLGLPELDGFALAQRIRADARLRHTPLIALSAYDGPRDRRRTAEVGFDHHLAKPLDWPRLAELLGQYVALARRAG